MQNWKKQVCLVAGAILLVPALSMADWTLSGKVVHEVENEGVWESTGYHTQLVFYTGSACYGSGRVEVGRLWSSDEGYFEVTGLPDGENIYIYQYVSSGYLTKHFVNEYYDSEERCQDAIALAETAIPLENEDPNDASSLEIFKIKLHEPTGGGTISGTVTLQGQPVANLQMQAYQNQCSGIVTYGETKTDENGNYVLEHLPAGNIYMQACPTCTVGFAYPDQWRTATSATTLDCNLSAPIPVSEGSEQNNIDFHLSEDVPATGAISGMIYTDDARTNPVSTYVWVYAYLDDACNGEYLGRFNTWNGTPRGSFHFDELPVGTIYIRTHVNSWHDYLETYYDGGNGTPLCQEAVGVDLMANGEISGRDIVVPLGGTIEGSVLSSGGETIGQTTVYPYVGQFPNGRWLQVANYTNDDGSYKIRPLPEGEITLLATPPAGFNNVWWTEDGVGVVVGADAHTINVVSGETATNADFSLVFNADIDNDNDVDGFDLAVLLSPERAPVANVVGMFADSFGSITPLFCESGYHNGGDGVCQPEGSCSYGYLLDGQDCLKKPNEMVFQGLQNDQQGFVSWNSTGDGPEPQRSGHEIPDEYRYCWVFGQRYTYANAYYYISSSDYPGVPLGNGTPINDQSSGAAHVAQPIDGFEQTKTALVAGGFAEDELHFSFGAMTLGADTQDQNWFFTGSVETRYYTGGDLVITLAGVPLLKGLMPDLTVSINYHEAQSCLDDTVVAKTDSLVAASFQDLTGAATPEVRAVAQSLLADLALLAPLSMDMTDLTPDLFEFLENGRSGRYFSINSLRLR